MPPLFYCVLPTHTLHAFITDDAFLTDTKKGAQKSSVHPDISL